jgi:hypothetical protein
MQRFFMLLIAALPGLAWADAPATRPAIDPATPRGALLAFSDSLPNGGLKAAAAGYHAANDKERALLQVLARYYVAASRLEQLTRQKFGEKAGNDVVHAMRERTDEDIVDAREKIDGDHATIEWADGRESLEMVKVDGKWKVPVSQIFAGDENPRDITATNTALAEAMEDILKQFETGEYANVYLLNRAVKQHMYRILGPDEADD